VFDFNFDPGEGNLNLRAYFAAVVGPKRATHGQRAIRRVPLLDSAQLAKNAAEQQAMYVEVWLAKQYVGAGLRVLFSSSEGMGESANLVTLVAAPGETDRYRAVLLPNEQLYAQAVSDAAGNPLGNPVSVVVSTAVF
jgi:hypothetical protein